MGGSSKQTVGYRYYLGVHMAICHGPVDSINKIYVADRLAASFSITTNTTYSLFQPDLFGGDKKEGGLVGKIDFLLGGSAQTKNSYLQSQLGTDIPAFRGVLSLVFREDETSDYRSSGGGGYITAMSPYPKPWAIEVTNIPGQVWYAAKANINSGSANPAHIIYEALTNQDWGAGLSDSYLDLTTFTAVADTLYTENFGLSLIYAQSSEIWDFIEEILNYINGLLYPDLETGLFVLKLIRDDYTIATLPVFDQTNTLHVVKFERTSYSDLTNEIILKYRKRGDLEDSSISVQDLAGIQAQEGVSSQTMTYLGIDTDDLAVRIAQRELQQRSTPLARIQIVVNREGWSIKPGDVIKFTWPELGISQTVLRIVQVAYGNMEDGDILLEGVEDIFALPDASYTSQTATGWSDEVVAPIAATIQNTVELPYWDAATRFQAGEFNAITSTSAFVQSLVSKPAIATFGYQLYTKPSGGSYELKLDSEYTPTAQLVGVLDREQLSINFDTLSDTNAGTSSYCIIDDEIFRIDAIDVDAGTATLGRGGNDTIPENHSDNATIYFPGDVENIDPTEYQTSEVIYTKALTQTSKGVLDISSATEDSVTMVGRMNKPYPPANIKINGFYFPVNIATTTVTATWAHRDRTQQTSGIIDWYQSSIGPETSVTYTFRVYNNTTSTLLNEQTGLTGTTANYSPSADAELRIEVFSERSGENSLQTFSHIFNYYQTNTGTGSLVSGSASMSGAGADIQTGTGSLVSGSASMSGAGVMARSGTGSLVSGSATMSGTGTVV